MKFSIFEPIENIEEAKKSLKDGAHMAFFIASLFFVAILFSFYTNPHENNRANDPVWYLLGLIFVLCGVGIMRYSRSVAIATFFFCCTASMVSFYVDLKRGTRLGNHITMIIMSILFLHGFIKAVRGTFAYHQFLEKAVQTWP